MTLIVRTEIMGTCSRGGSVGLVSRTVSGSHWTHRLRTDLERHEPARVLVNTAVTWVVATNPAVATVYAAYKLGTSVYEISSAYQRSTHAGNKRLSEEAKEEARDAVIDRISEVIVPTNLPVPATNLLRALVSSVVGEVLPS